MRLCKQDEEKEEKKNGAKKMDLSLFGIYF